MTETVYLSRPNREKEASGDDILQFENSALSLLRRGKDVYTIEAFPKRFFHYVSRIRLEKVDRVLPDLSALENAQLFKVVFSGSMYE